MPQDPQISEIYRYPVKGLGPERLSSADLRPGETLRLDRHYAIENGKGRFDPSAPKYLPKIHFLMLMRIEGLANLETRFDADTHVLKISLNGMLAAEGNLKTRQGRMAIEQFLAGYLADDLRGSPHIVQADGHSFSDVPVKCIHLVNLATVRDLEQHLGADVDPLRFRANIYFDGLDPWKEFDWLDRNIKIGSARAKVFARTERCAAANVDPKTGARDLTIPAALLRDFGHTDVGLYATIESGGTIRSGDALIALQNNEQG
ncbi:MAG: MOSC domain-containing protein [Methyloligellaceae bacterium]